jgi:hypothetical protein
MRSLSTLAAAFVVTSLPLLLVSAEQVAVDADKLRRLFDAADALRSAGEVASANGYSSNPDPNSNEPYVVPVVYDNGSGSNNNNNKDASVLDPAHSTAAKGNPDEPYVVPVVYENGGSDGSGSGAATLSDVRQRSRASDGGGGGVGSGPGSGGADDPYVVDTLVEDANGNVVDTGAAAGLPSGGSSPLEGGFADIKARRMTSSSDDSVSASPYACKVKPPPSRDMLQLDPRPPPPPPFHTTSFPLLP